MAISAAVFVGGMGPWQEALLQAAKSLKVTAGHEADADLGPMISREALDRAERIIAASIQQASDGDTRGPAHSGSVDNACESYLIGVL